MTTTQPIATKPIEPIERTTAASECTRALRERILGGAWQPGARLPAERALAGDFGVNRVTVRAALSTLAAEKLVDIKHGSGVRVADFLERGGPGLIADIVQLARGEDAAAAVADLLAVRRALAGVVLEKLAKKITEAGRGRIAAAVQSFARVVDEGAGAAEIARADLDVMRAIVGETGSPVLQLCLNPIAGVLVSLPSLCAAMFAQPERSVLAYQALLDALAQPEDAREHLAHGIGAILAAHDADTVAALGSTRRAR